MHKCLLCVSESIVEVFRNEKAQIFWKCQDCGFIFRSPEHHLSLNQQKNRYKLHQNSEHDKDYQNFLMPVIQAVRAHQRPHESGLDFGCGPSPTISFLLKKNNFQILDYDPIFFPRADFLQKQYDYVTCVEVIEHFSDPRKEFEILKNLLKPNAFAYIKTALTDGIKDFSKWYYHRDMTHVSFYNRTSLEFIKSHMNFRDLQIQNDLILFKL